MLTFVILFARINDLIPSRDFSPNLKQDLSGLSGFFRQLRSKSCFKMSGGVSWGEGMSGTSTREDRSKTAQKPLKSCLKNRSKITARNERFFKQDLSGLSGFSKKKTAQTTQTAQTAQILLENRSNRSNLERFLSGISTRDRSTGTS